MRRTLYTDGSTQRLAGGWAFIVLDEHGAMTMERHGIASAGSSIVSELAAVSSGVQYVLATRITTHLTIYTDNKPVQEFLSGQRDPQQLPPAGLRYWKRMIGYLRSVEVQSVWIGGITKSQQPHVKWHARCHHLALSASRGGHRAILRELAAGKIKPDKSSEKRFATSKLNK